MALYIYFNNYDFYIGYFIFTFLISLRSLLLLCCYIHTFILVTFDRCYCFVVTYTLLYWSLLIVVMALLLYIRFYIDHFLIVVTAGCYLNILYWILL
jgi:hypothetical protein